MNARLQKHQTETHVVKVGGTRAAEFESNFRMVAEAASSGNRHVVVFSAPRSTSERYKDLRLRGGNGFNTTDHLIGAAEAAIRGDATEAHQYIQNTEAFLCRLIQDQVQGEYVAAMQEVIQRDMSTLRSHIDQLLTLAEAERRTTVTQNGSSLVLKTEKGPFPLTGFGEIIAQNLYETYFRLRSLNVESLDLLEEVDGFREQVRTALAQNDVIVTGGYAHSLAAIRGYSELKAAEIAIALKEAGSSVRMNVHKDWPVMSGRPEDIQNAQLVNRMNWNEARALCSEEGANIGVVHPHAIDRLAKANVPTHVLNPDRPERGETIISDNPDEQVSHPARIVVSSGGVVFCIGEGIDAGQLPDGANQCGTLPAWQITGACPQRLHEQLIPA